VGIPPRCDVTALAISGIEILHQWYYRHDYMAIMADCANTAIGVWSENSHAPVCRTRQRYVDTTFASAGTGRQYSLVGDAELDEGAVCTAADRLEQIGVATEVVCVTSPGLLYEALQSRHGLGEAPSWILEQIFPAAPLVTVVDGHPHTLTFLATINHVPVRSLGVSRFG
jgi:hypothetical protein